MYYKYFISVSGPHTHFKQRLPGQCHTSGPSPSRKKARIQIFFKRDGRLWEGGQWWEKVGVEVNMLGRYKNFFMNVKNPNTCNYKKQTDMQVLNLYNFFSINFFSSVTNVLFITFSTFKIQKGVCLQLYTPSFLDPPVRFYFHNKDHAMQFSFSFWVLHAILLMKMAKPTTISFWHLASSNIVRLLWWWKRIYWCL